MKKLLTAILAALMVLTMVSGCGSNNLKFTHQELYSKAQSVGPYEFENENRGKLVEVTEPSAIYLPPSMRSETKPFLDAVNENLETKEQLLFGNTVIVRNNVSNDSIAFYLFDWSKLPEKDKDNLKNFIKAAQNNGYVYNKQVKFEGKLLRCFKTGNMMNFCFINCKLAE